MACATIEEMSTPERERLLDVIPSLTLAPALLLAMLFLLIHGSGSPTWEHERR